MATYQMSKLQYNRLMQIKHRWLPWHFIESSRLIVLTLCGIILCLGYNAITNALANRMPVVVNSVQPVLHNGWVTLIIDRTRKNFCDVKPSRIMFQEYNLDASHTVPFVIPVNSQNFVWPYIGRQIVALGLIREKDLTPGPWQIVTTQNEDCNWIDWLAGGREFTSKPVTINIPLLPLSEGQVK